MFQKGGFLIEGGVALNHAQILDWFLEVEAACCVHSHFEETVLLPVELTLFAV